MAALTSKFVGDAETLKEFGEEVDKSGKASGKKSKLKALIGKAFVPISVAVHVDYQRMGVGRPLQRSIIAVQHDG